MTREPGFRRNAAQLHSYLTGVSIAVIGMTAGVVTVVGLVLNRPGLAFSVALGAGVVVVTSLVGWLLMRLFDRLEVGGGWVMAVSYVLKLLALALVVAIFDDHRHYDGAIAGLAFIFSLLISLVITSIILTRHQSPIIDD